MRVVGQPQVGERWRYRYGSGYVVVVCEVTDVVARYQHEGGYTCVFGERLSSWHDTFEPVIEGN